MTRAISRAQFLRGDLQGRRVAIRPPWAIAEEQFVDRCSRCGDCVNNCPTGIIVPGRGGFPEVDFMRGECDFCGDCVTHCKPAALGFSSDEAQGEPWQLKAAISEECLTYQGVVCRSCGEQCESRAIRFKPVIAGISQPYLDSSDCSGCGACMRPCPVGAITLTQTHSNYNAQMHSEASL